MSNGLKRLFFAPVLADEDRTRAGRLAHAILMILLGLSMAVPLIILVASPAILVDILAYAIPMLVVTVGSLWLLQRGSVQLVSTILVLSSFAVVTGTLLAYQGIEDLSVTGYFLVVALAASLLGEQAVIWTGLLCGAAATGIYFVQTSGLIAVGGERISLTYQILALLVVLGLVTAFLRSATQRMRQSFDRVRGSAAALAAANQELEASRDALRARTDDLEQRSVYLEASSEVGRAAFSILDVELLMERVVNLISECFGLYYVGLFLLDETRQRAVLRAATGRAGRALLDRGHSIAIGEGMVGWCISRRQSRVALDAARDAVRLATPELPETRSEAALPLRSRGQVVGAISVQHEERGAFDPETITMLQTMADQVAVALDNARLFAEGQAALEAERRAYGEISRQAWLDMIRNRADLGYICRREGTTRPLSSNLDPKEEGLAQAAGAAKGDALQDGGGAVSLPIRIRDHQVGTVRLRKGKESGQWTADEVALMESLTEQLEVALESARLYQDTQHRAVRDRLLAEVSGRIRESLDVDAVLRSAALEVRQALDLPEVVVRLKDVSDGPGVAGDGWQLENDDLGGAAYGP